MKRLLTLSLILLCLPLCASAQDEYVRQAPPSPQLQKAIDLYFDFKQEESLEKFIEVSKQTGEREAFLNAAYVALELGNSRLAVDTISMALKKFPTDTQVLEFAGEAYLAAGYYLNAENVFARLTENNNKTEFYYISLARAQMGLGQLDLAEVNLKQAAHGVNHLPLANFMLGELYTKQGKYDKAADAFKKVMESDSQFIEAKQRYANVLAKLKQSNKAYSSYAKEEVAQENAKNAQEIIRKIKPLVTPVDTEFDSYSAPSRRHTHVKKPVSYDGELPMIRVGLGVKVNGSPLGMDSIKFSTSNDFSAVDEKGKTITAGGPGKFWEAAIINKKPYLISPGGIKTGFNTSVKIVQDSDDDNSHTTILKDMLTGHGMTWMSRDDKEYRGVIEFDYNRSLNAFVVINHVNLEEYVFGVVASEMPSIFPTEALKSQAVIARTYALKAMGKHKSWGYDVCDAQHCQVYGGVKAERERTNAAAEATMGVVLTYKNKPIEAVFSSNCGGYTQSSGEAGWYPHPYLKPVSDYQDFNESNLQPYNFKELLQHTRPAFSRYFKNVSPSTFRWTRYLREDQIRQIVSQKKNIGNIKAIIPLKRGKSGYVNGVKIVGTQGTLILNKEHEIKKYLALGMLRSTYFIVEPNLENGIPKSFIFYGGGWGHGVGLCQTGTGGRADAGQNFKQILRHYYSDVELKDIRTDRQIN